MAGQQDNKAKPKGVFREAFGFWGTLGVILGAVSIFNLIVKGFDVGLAPVMQDIVDTYVWLFHGLFDWFFRWLPWQIPAWMKDAFAIYIVGIGICIRFYGVFAKTLGKNLFSHAFEGLIQETSIYLRAILGVLFWPVLIIILLTIKHVQFEFSNHSWNLRFVLVFQIFAVFFGVLGLVVANAGLQMAG